MKVLLKSLTVGLGLGLVIGVGLSALIYLSTRWRIRSQDIDPGVAATMLCSADMASFYAPMFTSFLGLGLGGVLGICIVGYRLIVRSRIA